MSLHDWIMAYLDPVSVVVGLLIAVPVLWTWYEVAWGRRRRDRRWFAQARADKGERASILIVDLLPGKDIRAQVERFRRADSTLAAVPDDRVYCVTEESRIVPERVPYIVECLRVQAAAIIRSGTDITHVFYAGPAILTALIGAEFANIGRVLLYHHEADGYINFGPLKHRL